MSAPSALGEQRREASRRTWSQQHTGLLACFLLTLRSRTSTPSLSIEAARERDLVFFDVPESATLTEVQARRAGYRKRRHGHCVFKNYAWFRHVQKFWQHVPWVAKVDDDTFLNVPLLLGTLRALRCHEHVFLGPMMWTSWLNEVRALGIRSLPCGFSTGGLLGALNFLRDRTLMSILFGSARSVTNRPCDALGATPPFPFALGGGYIFSAPLLAWLANASDIREWVEAAQAARTGESQVVFFSDTTTGYWLSFAPMPILYVDVAAFSHDHCCHREGPAYEAHAADTIKRRGGGASRVQWRCNPHMNHRPPTSSSLIVHGLKQGGFDFALEQTSAAAIGTAARGSLPQGRGYSFERCLADVFLPPASQTVT